MRLTEKTEEVVWIEQRERTKFCSIEVLGAGDQGQGKRQPRCLGKSCRRGRGKSGESEVLEAK